MRVALDIFPLHSGHKDRGIGVYTKNLKNGLEKSVVELITFNQNQTNLNADIAHVPYFDLYFKTYQPNKNIKNIVTIHDVMPLVFPQHFKVGLKGKINLIFQKKSLQRATAIICDSISSKNDIIKYLGIKSEKIFVVYLGVSDIFKKINNLASLEKIRKEFGLPDTFFLYVGDVNWNKNVPNLINAIKISKGNLVLVGKSFCDDNLEENSNINKIIRDNNLERHIFKLGYVTDDKLACLYNLAQANIQPSYYEGFGLPTLESMSCGTPAIITKNSSLEEIGGDAAIYSKSEAAENIANAIRAVQNLKKDQRSLLSSKSIKQASKFSWEKTIDKTIKIYKKINEKN